MEDAFLVSLLVVDYELYRHASATTPLRVRQIAAPSLELMMVWDSAEAITRINCGVRVPVVLVEENPCLVLKMSERGYGVEIGRVILAGPATDLLDNDHARRAY